MRESVAGLVAGMLFGSGLALSGMTQPAIVLGFLDVAGDWNPALAFVLAGALGVTFVGYRLIWRRGSPLWAPRFQLPTSSRIDAPLVAGAALFGVGWGIAGWCPGPAIASLASPSTSLVLFVSGMIAGMMAIRAHRLNKAEKIAESAVR